MRFGTPAPQPPVDFPRENPASKHPKHCLGEMSDNKFLARVNRGAVPAVGAFPSPGRVKLAPGCAAKARRFFFHRMAPRSPRQCQRCMGVPTPDASHREGGCSGTRPPSSWADMLLNGASGDRRDYAGMNGTGNTPSCRRTGGGYSLSVLLLRHKSGLFMMSPSVIGAGNCTRLVFATMAFFHWFASSPCSPPGLGGNWSKT